MSDHLTLNYGLRYETHTPWIEQNDQQDNYNIRTGQVEYANQNGASRALYSGTYGLKAFQPRLGFAWTPGGRLGAHTVLRGAFTVLRLSGRHRNQPPPAYQSSFRRWSKHRRQIQTQYLNQALPTTVASDGIIAPPPAGLACPNFSCFQSHLPFVGQECATCA